MLDFVGKNWSEIDSEAQLEDDGYRFLLVGMLRQVFDDVKGLGCVTGGSGMQGENNEQIQARLKRLAIDYVFEDHRSVKDPGSIRWLSHLLQIPLDKIRKRALDLSLLTREEAHKLWKMS